MKFQQNASKSNEKIVDNQTKYDDDKSYIINLHKYEQQLEQFLIKKSEIFFGINYKKES